MAEAPQPLVRGDKWLDIGSPYRMAGRRGPQHHTLEDSKQAIGHLKIALVTGGMERNQDVVGQSAMPPGRAALRRPDILVEDGIGHDDGGACLETAQVGVEAGQPERPPADPARRLGGHRTDPVWHG